MWIRDQGSSIEETMLRRYNYNPEGWWGGESNEKDSLNSDWLRQTSNQTYKKTLRCLGTFFVGFFFFWLQNTKFRQKSALVWKTFWDIARKHRRDSDAETAGPMNNSENQLWVVPSSTWLCLWNTLIFIVSVVLPKAKLAMELTRKTLGSILLVILLILSKCK